MPPSIDTMQCSIGLLHGILRIFSSTYKKQTPLRGACFLVDPRRFAVFASRWETNYSAAAVQPAADSSPLDCCIEWFESPFEHIKIQAPLQGTCIFWWTRGNSLHLLPGRRQIIVQPPSSRRLAAVHWTAALNGSNLLLNI